MTLVEAKKAIAEIESVDLTRDEAYDRIIFILRSLGEMPIFGFIMEPHEELYYTRARPLDHIEDYVDSIQGHSYNPNAKDVSLGRANLPGQQIFYLGRVRLTSLAVVNIIEIKWTKKKSRMQYLVGLLQKQCVLRPY